MTQKTQLWDAADTLKTTEDIAAYLDAVLEDGDPDLLKAALDDIGRAISLKLRGGVGQIISPT